MKHLKDTSDYHKRLHKSRPISQLRGKMCLQHHRLLLLLHVITTLKIITTVLSSIELDPIQQFDTYVRNFPGFNNESIDIFQEQINYFATLMYPSVGYGSVKLSLKVTMLWSNLQNIKIANLFLADAVLNNIDIFNTTSAMFESLIEKNTIIENILRSLFVSYSTLDPKEASLVFGKLNMPLEIKKYRSKLWFKNIKSV